MANYKLRGKTRFAYYLNDAYSGTFTSEQKRNLHLLKTLKLHIKSFGQTDYKIKLVAFRE